MKSKFGNDAIDYAKMNSHAKVARFLEDKVPKPQALVVNSASTPTSLHSTIIFVILLVFSQFQSV